MEQVKRPPPRGNQIQQIGPREHFVFFANLLDHVNLTEPGSYDVQIVAQNRSPERYLDKAHPSLPPSKLVRGPVESNHWQFTIERGSGDAFELVNQPLREKTAGTFALCPNANLIVERYSDSPYGPYAVSCEIDRLLRTDPQGEEPIANRLAAAQALMTGLRTTRPGFEYLDVAMIRYATRLAEVGEKESATNMLRELERGEQHDAGRLYVQRLLSTR
jgi:hypothetical protein